MVSFNMKGWVETGGRRLSRQEISAMLSEDPRRATVFGGEFLLSWDGWSARDALGIIQGAIPPGTLVRNGEVVGRMDPPVPVMDLESAVVEAVRLRSDEGVVALSGGVDSAFVAVLARLPCVAVGTGESHDLRMAARAARLCGLSCEYVQVGDGEVEEALRAVIHAIPDKNPVDASIAVVQYFIARWAGENGHERVLTGQGADELFGGYARYLSAEDVDAQLQRDFAGLQAQGARDQAVAALHGAYLSLPYLDLRVVGAARAIPSAEKVAGGVRKKALREVAARHIPPEIAWYEKKAMQYGSGVWKVIQRLSRQNGHRNVREYIEVLLQDRSD